MDSRHDALNTAVQERELERLCADDLDAGSVYDAAFVYLLPDELARAIAALRRALADFGARETQLTPHATVVYLGRRTGAQLLRCAGLLLQAGPAAAATAVEGFGYFGDDSVVGNLHCRLEPTALARQHVRCLDLLATIGEKADTPFVRERYRPHISLFDGIALPRAQAESAVAARVRCPSWRGNVEKFALMWKRVGDRAAGA